MSLRMRYKKEIDNYMMKQNTSMGANAIIHNLWDIWGSDAPTRREIGIYLKTNPNYQQVGIGQYQWLAR